MAIGTTKTALISELKTITSPDPTTNNIYYIRDAGKEGGFVWDTSILPGSILATDPRLDSILIKHATITTGIFRRVINDDNINVKWFGATGNGSTDDQPSIQKAINAAIANMVLPRTIYFPAGTYKIDHPLIIANFNTGTNVYDQCTILLKGEEVGNNRFSAKGAQIKPSFKNQFAIGFHIAKSGGIVGLTIIGNYAPPVRTVESFFNNNPFSSYLDSTCRDSTFSPYAGVVIDPFRANSLPPDGGYPGFVDAANTILLQTYYQRAPTMNTTSGSSGLYFKDLYIEKFVVGMIQSPNGETQQGEGIIYEDIQVVDCKLAFASCQPQEKANIYKNIICWGTVHTVFSNQDYGIHNGAGNIIIENVNLANAVNRFMNWSAGGWFPSYVKNVYAERLGSFGNFTSGGTACSVENSMIDFIEPHQDGRYYPDFHMNISREITFRSCVLRINGTSLPILINGSGVFNECSFTTVPFTRIEEGFSSGDTTQFYNCMYALSINGKIGSREVLRGALNQFGNYSLHGDYKIIDANNQIYGTYGEFSIKSPQSRALIDLSITTTIAITGPTRSFTFSTTFNDYFQVNQPVVLIQGASFFFGGIVTISTSGSVTVSYVPFGVSNGSYKICPNPSLKPFRILGDISSSINPNTVINVKSGQFSGSIGDVVNLPEFGGYVVIKTTTPTTYTFNRNALFSKNGVTLSPSGIQFKFNSLNPYAPSSTQVPLTTVFKKGDVLVDTYQGITRNYICITDGIYDPAHAQRAYFTLDGNAEYNLLANGSISIPSDVMVEGFILKSSANLSVLTIGTTNGGTQISAGLSLTAGVSKVQDWNQFTDTQMNIYFGGITSGSLLVKVIIKLT